MQETSGYILDSCLGLWRAADFSLQILWFIIMKIKYVESIYIYITAFAVFFVMNPQSVDMFCPFNGTWERWFIATKASDVSCETGVWAVTGIGPFM